ncbi:MAG: CDP-6-deoxy-delta-3,4-glucoseen reductase [Pseudomonadota bacterium]
MSFKVSVSPSQHQFLVEADESILDAALRQGLTLPYGCRDGACGACRGKVLSGDFAHGAIRQKALSEAERAAGYALFCCARAESDLAIECREITSLQDIPVRTLPARVQKMTRAAPDVMILELKLPANERLQFLAGQYIDILLKDGKRRAFSLANAPHDDAALQIHIRHLPGGLFTDHVFTTMKERDILRFSGPKGSFFLREASTKPMLLVAGGTGFAPIKAIIEHALAEQSTRSMRLYWGGQQVADVYLAELAEQWARDYAQIEFVPVLSAPQSELNATAPWLGRTGLVHQAVMQDFSDLSEHEVYVCGAPAMVAAAREDFLTRCKLPEEAFFADAFELANDR